MQRFVYGIQAAYPKQVIRFPYRTSTLSNLYWNHSTIFVLVPHLIRDGNEQSEFMSVLPTNPTH